MREGNSKAEMLIIKKPEAFSFRKCARLGQAWLGEPRAASYTLMEAKKLVIDSLEIVKVRVF